MLNSYYVPDTVLEIWEQKKNTVILAPQSSQTSEQTCDQLLLTQEAELVKHEKAR